MLISAATTLLREGGMLWADGKLTWDYTPFGSQLLARAKQAAPACIVLYAHSTVLPRRGHRPAKIIRVSPDTQASISIRESRPVYPPEARKRGIEGTVRLAILVDTEGGVRRVEPESGRPELIPPAAAAVGTGGISVAFSKVSRVA